MRREQGQAAIFALILLLAAALGFWGGCRLLPHSPLAQSSAFTGGIIYGSLPYAFALADEPAGGYSAAPVAVSAPATAQITQTAPSGFVKAEPRLIMIAKDSVTVFAAQNLAAQTAAAGQDSGEPHIAIYCTHSSEEYKNQPRIPGARGGVHTVAERLSDSLNALGLATVYCDTVHDYPDWDLSYASSLKSAQGLQQQYPSLEVFIDVHRDSLANSVLATGNGQVARIMLVVGSDARLAHPNWRQNKAFSEQIQQALEARTPGLTRSVSVQQGRYNQHISGQAILVEMGSTANTVEEACASAELLAQALALLLK